MHRNCIQKPNCLDMFQMTSGFGVSQMLGFIASQKDYRKVKIGTRQLLILVIYSMRTLTYRGGGGGPLDPEVLYYGGILRFSSPILWGYLQVLKSYIMEVTLGPQVLYYGGTFRSSSPILWGYPYVLESYIMRVPLGHQILHYGGTVRSSSAILWEYLQVLKSCIMEVSLGPQVLYYEVTSEDRT